MNNQFSCSLVFAQSDNRFGFAIFYIKFFNILFIYIINCDNPVK